MRTVLRYCLVFLELKTGIYSVIGNVTTLYIRTETGEKCNEMMQILSKRKIVSK